MGERPECVFNTGCPSIDVAHRALETPEVDFEALFKRHGGVGEKLDLSGGYLVVAQHPVTTEYDESRAHIEETLHAIAELRVPTLWFWPNVDAGSDGTSKGIRIFRETHPVLHVHFFKNLPPEEFIRVIYHSRCIVGNSSVAIRESSYLGVPAINIGTRQDGRERSANVTDVPYDRGEIKRAIENSVREGRFEPDHLYGEGRSGERIAELLAKVPLQIDKRLTY
jgi:UDP-hydrolysing UDP-N-acetyl-D-glucosamine 2-epimerase